MADLSDYLATGVLGHHAGDVHAPDGIWRDLEEGALDYADQVIADYRAKDRMFDALCEDGSQMWTWWEGATADHLRVGSRVRLRKQDSQWEDQYVGVVTAFDVDFWDHPVAILDGDRYRQFRLSDWEGRGLLMVPVPVDLTTLGQHAGPTVHV